jgi:DNA gyrase inhibitor GyrI
MKTPEVRIVQLEPARVAVGYGFGNNPEHIAWEKILTFAHQQGFMDGYYCPRFFGFNNPDPTPGSPNYGYEQWLVVPENVEAMGDIQIKDFSGGLFAVLRFKGLENIGKAWADLVAWVEISPYKMVHRDCLEEQLSSPEDTVGIEKLIFDLYLPIVAK